MIVSILGMLNENGTGIEQAEALALRSAGTSTQGWVAMTATSQPAATAPASRADSSAVCTPGGGARAPRQ
jgi:hypothetical protein